MSEIESSSRLYREGDNLFLTVPIAARREDGTIQSTPLGFVLTREVLLTVRFEPIKICEGQRPAGPGSDRPLAGGAGALIGLLEALVDHLADDLENVTARLDQSSQSIFNTQIPTSRGRSVGDDRGLRTVLVDIGHVRALTSRISQTLLMVTRMTRYVATEASDRLNPDAKARLSRVARDSLSLSEHETHLSEKIQFLLDASLGLISVDQNDIFKILTMVSVIGIPPTLLASMYGMNFKNMPEYDWPWGYQYGLFVIFISALIPLLWFKWRRWW
jgi:magnesium transporter